MGCYHLLLITDNEQSLGEEETQFRVLYSLETQKAVMDSFKFKVTGMVHATQINQHDDGKRFV